jgi:hypothetical protein
MRITVDITESLYRELKSKAAQEGRSVKELILRASESSCSGRLGDGGRYHCR